MSDNGLCDWNGVYDWLCNRLKGNFFLIIVRKLALASTVYELWKEDLRCHKEQFTDQLSVVAWVMNQVHWKITSFKRVINPDNRDLCVMWDFHLFLLVHTNEK